MHPLHDYVAKQVGDRLKAKRILVWYDARAELAPFLGELRGAASRVAGCGQGWGPPRDRQPLRPRRDRGERS